MAKKFPSTPPHPERLCWGCDLYCPATDLRCGNGSDRTPHPCELWGEDWDRDPAPPHPLHPKRLWLHKKRLCTTMQSPKIITLENASAQR